MTEKGNHIKVRRQLEQLTSEHTQLAADSSQLRDDVAKLTSDAETFVSRDAELKMAAEKLSAELRSASVDRDRLARELEDRRVRDVAVQDNIQVCCTSLPDRTPDGSCYFSVTLSYLNSVQRRHVLEHHVGQIVPYLTSVWETVMSHHGLLFIAVLAQRCISIQRST